MKSFYKSLLLLFFVVAISATTNAQNALSFDGVDDYITVPAASNLIANQNMSISLWVYPTNSAPNFPNLDGFAGIRNNSNADFYMIQIGASTVEARFRNSSGTNYDVLFTGLILNSWNHFVMTYDGSTLTLYHNGVSVGTEPASGTITSTTETFYIGSVPFNATNFYLNGQLDDVSLWSKSVSSSEVTTLYNACNVNLNSSNLELCYEFNQGTAGGNNTSITSALDSKGNINGTFNGFALSGNTSNYVAYGNNASSTLNINLCDVPSYTSPLGNILTSSGTYQETIINGSYTGCDSIITINLALGNTTNTTTINPTTCNSYTSPSGNVYTTAGTYLDTLTGFAGCDSIITINLSFNQASTSTLSIQICDSYTAPSGNNTWTTSGTYTDILTNAAGCDSIITINLTIGNNTGSEDVFACGSYISPSGTDVWNVSGTYTDILTNAAGCDSVVTINLTIGNNTGNEDVFACSNYVSPGGNIWMSSGVYIDSLTNFAGCDSIVTVNLTIGNNTGSEVVSACNSYTSQSGNLYTSSNDYIEIFTNAAGCDSVFTISLTIISIDTSVTQNTHTLTANLNGATYQWIDCSTNQPIANETNQSFTPSADGSYAVIITKNGCSKTSDCYLVEPVSTSSIFETSISAFPNPTTGMLQIDLGKSYDNIQTSISNVIGKVVFTNFYTNQNTIQFDLSEYPKGLYFINIQSNDKQAVLKIIVE